MKAESHKLITETALQYYKNQGLSSFFLSALNDELNSKSLLNGTMDEDDITPTRLLNWHFYPANSKIKEEDREIFFNLKVRPTSLWLFKKRQEKLLSLLEEKESVERLFSTFGRILHHIQDMNTPSHVVPVYHAHSPEDRLETFLINEWRTIKTQLDALNAHFNQFLIVNAFTVINDFAQLYHDAANRLIGALSSSNGGPFPVDLTGAGDTATSDVFWRPYKSAVEVEGIPLSIKGFGTFGPAGENFGKNEPITVNGKQLIVQQDIFLDIATFFVKSAICDTLLALKHFDYMLSDY